MSTIATKSIDHLAADIPKLTKAVDEMFPQDISVTEVVDCAVKCMSIAGSMDGLTGPEKKDVVIYLVTYAVTSKTEGEIPDAMQTILTYIIPRVIDRLIDTENGKIRFNHKGVRNFIMKLPCYS